MTSSVVLRMSADVVLSVENGGGVVDEGLDISFHAVLPLLIGCRCLVLEFVVGVVYLGCFGDECGEIVCTEDSWCESVVEKILDDAVKIVEERVLVRALDGIGE